VGFAQSRWVVDVWQHWMLGVALAYFLQEGKADPGYPVLKVK
jgi:hypothetical protein